MAAANRRRPSSLMLRLGPRVALADSVGGAGALTAGSLPPVHAVLQLLCRCCASLLMMSLISLSNDDLPAGISSTNIIARLRAYSALIASGVGGCPSQINQIAIPQVPVNRPFMSNMPYPVLFKYRDGSFTTSATAQWQTERLYRVFNLSLANCYFSVCPFPR